MFAIIERKKPSYGSVHPTAFNSQLKEHEICGDVQPYDKSTSYPVVVVYSKIKVLIDGKETASA